MGRLRHLAILLTLTGVLLRGTLPMGWMPDAQGTFTLCSVDGAHHSAPGDQPIKQDHGDMVCPFAAAAHLAPSLVFGFLPAERREVNFERPSQASRAVITASRHNPNTPRAPPLTA